VDSLFSGSCHAATVSITAIGERMGVLVASRSKSFSVASKAVVIMYLSVVVGDSFLMERINLFLLRGVGSIKPGDFRDARFCPDCRKRCPSGGSAWICNPYSGSKRNPFCPRAAGIDSNSEELLNALTPGERIQSAFLRRWNAIAGESRWPRCGCTQPVTSKTMTASTRPRSAARAM